jgi:hypothetical protein
VQIAPRERLIVALRSHAGMIQEIGRKAFGSRNAGDGVYFDRSMKAQYTAVALALLAVGACSRDAPADFEGTDVHVGDGGAGGQGAISGGVGGSSAQSGSGGSGAAGSGGSIIATDAGGGTGGSAATGGSSAGGAAGFDAGVAGHVRCGSTSCDLAELVCCDYYNAEPACLVSGTRCSRGATVGCDGGEDCAAGEVCCATVSTRGGQSRYDHVECKNTCNASNERIVCSDTFVTTTGSGSVDAGTGGSSGACLSPLCPNGVQPCGVTCLAPCPTGYFCDMGCCNRARYCPDGTTCSPSDIDAAYRECR